MDYNLQRGRISLRVVDSHDDYLACLLMRAAVFVGEGGCTLAEEIDGNDVAAAHIIARVDGHPAGTMRIRWFANFAVLERMAVLSRYRRGRHGAHGVAWETGAFAFHFAREKGYTRFYGSARDGLVDFWRSFAPEGATFDPIDGASLVTGGMVCHPMEGHAPPLPGAVVDLTDHALLNSRESLIHARMEERSSLVNRG